MGIFEPVDGILGMSRNLDSPFGFDLGDKGPLMVDALIDNNFISDRKFSFYFVRNKDGPLSFVDFGAPQP